MSGDEREGAKTRRKQSQIDELLERLCPEGVEYKRLGDIARIKNGKDHKSLGDGNFPVYGSGGIMRYVNTYAYDRPSVLIPRKGSLGNLFYVDVPFWNVDTIFYTEIDDAQIQPKFLYYFLTIVGLGEMNQAGGVPSQTQSVLNEVKIPIPPLEVQREIVNVLDTFTQLEAELEAELEARRTQYTYYRNRLLDFASGRTGFAKIDALLERLCPEGVKFRELGELGVIFGGLTGKSKADFSNGNARFVSYVNVFNNIAVNVEAPDFVKIEAGERQRTLQRGDILFTGSSETVDEVGMSSVITADVQEPLYLNSFCIGYRLNDPNILEPGFTKYLFRSDEMRKQIVKTASGVTRFNVSKARLAKIKIPLPPLEVQREIVAILDKFDALVNDLTSGLPAEIEARRKQYQYYRDRLLTFKEKETA